MMSKYCVVLFYKYFSFSPDELDDWSRDLKAFTVENGLKGRILLAIEGINGTVAGKEDSVKSFVDYIVHLSDNRLKNIDWKFSSGDGDLPFIDMYIKVADELISTGPAKKLINENVYFNPDSFGGLGGTGTHLSPTEFHDALENDPDSIVLDIRNDFEYDIGHFENAVNLKTNTFAESWQSLDNILVDLDNNSSQEIDAKPSKNFYMYCTGGIRCEKASAYLKSKGHCNVYQLQGGIHRYLEEIPSSSKKFLGRNFVFDSRMIDCDRSKFSADDDDNRIVVGRCVECNCPHDTYLCDQRCSVCRQPVLICPSCRAKCISTKFNEVVSAESNHTREFHCKNHRYLKDFYFNRLECFSLEALSSQLQELTCLVDNSDVFGGKEHKKRRKTLRNQIQRIEKEIISRSNGQHNNKKCSVNSTSPMVIGGIWG